MSVVVRHSATLKYGDGVPRKFEIKVDLQDALEVLAARIVRMRRKSAGCLSGAIQVSVTEEETR